MNAKKVLYRELPYEVRKFYQQPYAPVPAIVFKLSNKSFRVMCNDGADGCVHQWTFTDEWKYKTLEKK